MKNSTITSTAHLDLGAEQHKGWRCLGNCLVPQHRNLRLDSGTVCHFFIISFFSSVTGWHRFSVFTSSDRSSHRWGFNHLTGSGEKINDQDLLFT